MSPLPRAGLVALSLACSFSAACSGGDDACADLPGALAAASAGETVNLGACTVTGDIVVPEGVVVAGVGERTVLAGSVTLDGGAGLRALSVEATGPVGVAINGNGDPATLTEVRVTSATGVAIRADSRGAALTDVTLRGPVTPDNAPSVAPMPSAEDTATHGLLLTNAGTVEAPVTIRGLVISGFARFGALFIDSHVVWEGGSSAENLGVGLMAEGGSVDISAVALDDNLQGIQPFPAFGAVFTAGCDVQTVDLAIGGNEGYGALHDDATVSHENLVAADNADAALWAQATRDFALTGASTALTGNRLAGLVLVDTSTAMVRDASIDMSRNATRIEGETGSIEVGDGVHAVVPSVSGLVFEGVTLTGNERAGMLLDIGDDDPTGAVMDVTVDGSGASLGVIAQGPGGLVELGGWDSDVTRLGATAANDAALEAALDVVGIVAPMFLPPPTM